MEKGKLLPEYKAEFNPSDLEFGLGLTCIGLVDQPAILVDWVKMNKQSQFKVQNKEERILIGPAMVAGMRIYRVDENTGEEYYLSFDAETIKKLARYFMKQHLSSNFNLNHNPNEPVSEVYIFQSWFVNDSGEKEKEFGFDLTTGSWMIGVGVDNDEVWEEYIATGKLRGFSIEAFLKYVQVKFRDGKSPAQVQYELLKGIFSEVIK